MEKETNWTLLLQDHPIFSMAQHPSKDMDASELSRDTDLDEVLVASRLQVMCMRGTDLILAMESELRMLNLTDTQLSGGSDKRYKILHTPNIQFSIHQVVLNSTGQLLAVAGAYEVGIVVMPRGGDSKLVQSRVDCRSLQVGQLFHSELSSPIVKIDWHPWGQSASTLLVMTADGNLREYDVSINPEEPQQTLYFGQKRRRGSIIAEDDSEKEVVSFMLGKGKADWGPLTIYALMRNGDIFSICPYMPRNAFIPASYIYALECYVNAKQESLSERISESDSFTMLYTYQRKYVKALLKQLRSKGNSSLASRIVSVHPPSMNVVVSRQGPFLLQPSPLELDGSPGTDATDIVYISCATTFDDGDNSSDVSEKREQIGVIILSMQDGRIDVFLDLEKVEAKWDVSPDLAKALPMFAFYETIDLGAIDSLRSQGASGEDALHHLQKNFPVFLLDPIHDDTVHVYHAFGVHTLNFGPLLNHLLQSLNEEDDNAFMNALARHNSVLVQPILNTISPNIKYSAPVIAVVLSNDVYLPYSIFIFTSAMTLVSYPLNLRSNPFDLMSLEGLQESKSGMSNMPPAYVSLLEASPFAITKLQSTSTGASLLSQLSSSSVQRTAEAQASPETLRLFGSALNHFLAQIRDTQLLRNGLLSRLDLQQKEYKRQHEKCAQLMSSISNLKETTHSRTSLRLKDAQAQQHMLLSRMGRVLQALINKASPEINEYENRWFNELKRMQIRIMGRGHDMNSLHARVQSLKAQMDRLSPILANLMNEGGVGGLKSHEEKSPFNFARSLTYGRQSESQLQKLDRAADQLSKLAEKLEI